MIIWEKHGARLRSLGPLGAKGSLVFECHDQDEYGRLALFPKVLERGITLREPNRFFLAFNAALHLVNVSDLHKNLGSRFQHGHYQKILDYYFHRDPSKTLDILFSAPLENAQAHGNRFDPKKKVVVEYEFEESEDHLLLTVSFTDEGAGFDWRHLLASHRQAAQSYHLEKDSPNPHLRNQFSHAQGLALYSLLGLCGKVEFNEPGNRITLIKELRV